MPNASHSAALHATARKIFVGVTLRLEGALGLRLGCGMPTLNWIGKEAVVNHRLYSAAFKHSVSAADGLSSNCFVQIAQRKSVDARRDAVSEVEIETKCNNVVSLLSERFPQTQISICVWFIGKTQNVRAKLSENSNAGLHASTASEFFAFPLN